MYYMCPFHELFPDQAWKECRVMTILQPGDLPVGEYGWIESYCLDPDCDCRRVMFSVLSRFGKEYLAYISFGFDRDAEGAGPYLDPLNPQSAYAPAFLELARTVLLADPSYVARLESHYRQVKAAVAHPTPAVREVMRRYRLTEAALAERMVGRNRKRPAPGSRKKAGRRR
jgi:hypothetical protein